MENANQEYRMNMPLLGDQFPQMEVQTTQGPVSLPKAYAGKWFLLFSHPADFTPVCATRSSRS